jgi:hypothetical protein
MLNPTLETVLLSVLAIFATVAAVAIACLFVIALFIIVRQAWRD